MNVPANIPQRREIQTVIDAVPILDTARFEHMQRIAAVLARSTMIPETLRCFGPRDKREDLPFEQVLSNCFLVVNQAARWGMDPFSVISCCAVVHGRLAYEGKLVSAVLAAKLSISLNHYFTGDAGSDGYRIYLCDRPFTDELIAQLKPGVKIPGLRLWDGSVGEWKTSGAGTPWTPKNYPRMLIYRGTRDWTRIYESAILLGVYTEDELADLTEDARARRAIPVTSSLVDRLTVAKAAGNGESDGFSHDHVTRETGGDTEAQRDAADKTPPPASTGDEPLASEREPAAAGSGAVQDRSESTAPPNSSEHLQIPQSDAQADTPAAELDSPSMAAGDHPSDSPSDDGDEQAGNVSGTGVPSNLPEGWGLLYAAALRRAQKKDSLGKLASQFWNQYGGWDQIKLTDAKDTAAAIFDAFSKNFGDKDQIELELREII